MKLKEIGEFGLINRIYRKVKDKDVKVGIGDDAAVVKVGNKLLLITTDTIVEGDHFSLKYFTPIQVGKKAIEINISDIGAMGGKPRWALVSLVLPKERIVKVIDGKYKGMGKAGDK